MFGGFVSSVVGAGVDATNYSHTETFQSQHAAPTPARSALVSFLTVGIVFFIILFVGKWLWNNSLVPLISIAKPVKSVWQILGLAVLISLLSPGCC